MSVANLLTTGNIFDKGTETANPQFQTLEVSGATTLQGTLALTGTSTLTDAVSCGSRVTFANSTPNVSLFQLEYTQSGSGSPVTVTNLCVEQTDSPHTLGVNRIDIIKADGTASYGIYNDGSAAGMVIQSCIFPTNGGQASFTSATSATVTVAAVTASATIVATPLFAFPAGQSFWVIPGSGSFTINTSAAVTGSFAYFIVHF